MNQNCGYKPTFRDDNSDWIPQRATVRHMAASWGLSPEVVCTMIHTLELRPVACDNGVYYFDDNAIGALMVALMDAGAIENPIITVPVTVEFDHE